MEATHPVKLNALIAFLKTILPPIERDVPFLYHEPRQVKIETAEVSRLIFSVTPTKGIYKTFHLPRRRGVDVYFLHRPWQLQRPKGAEIWRRPRIVLSSHKGFDELLTVGWNVPLALRLGLATERAICLRGYKGDPDRRIGLIAPFKNDLSHNDSATALNGDTLPGKDRFVVSEEIRQHFGSVEAAFGFNNENATTTSETASEMDESVRIIAIMNAFHPAEIERIATTAVEAGLINDPMLCQSILCLTGEPRDEGIDAARARGMKIVCVGHRTCEDWGIRYLMECVQREYPFLELHLVDEPEEFDEQKPRATDKPSKQASQAVPIELPA